MRVLGRKLAPPFDAFWETYGDEIGVAAEQVEEGRSVVFGDQGADVAAPRLPGWASLPDDDLAYHVAHELAHVLLSRRGFPRTGRGPGYPDDSAEARIGGDIEEMVIHPPLEDLLASFGFRNDFIRRRMRDGALNGVSRSPVPEYGTPWFFTWAVRYCELRLELRPEEWQSLEEAFRWRSPQVQQLGEELFAIMQEVGWGSREQALEAMLRVRDALGLGVDGRVLVIDPVGDQVL